MYGWCNNGSYFYFYPEWYKYYDYSNYSSNDTNSTYIFIGYYDYYSSEYTSSGINIYRYKNGSIYEYKKDYYNYTLNITYTDYRTEDCNFTR